MKIRRTLVAVGAVCALTVVAGCQSSPQNESTPAATSSTPTATEKAPAWQAKYSPEEITGYYAALARWDAYERAAAPVWAAGQATPAAKKVFQKYFIPWNYYFSLLKTYESGDYHTEGLPDVLTSEPTRIKLSASDRGSVSIRQCVDYSSVTTTKGGQPVERSTTKPQRRDIVLSTPQGGGDWLITSLTLGEATCGA